MFLETSALTGENVEEAFLKCGRTILNKIESGNNTHTYTHLLLIAARGAMLCTRELHAFT